VNVFVDLIGDTTPTTTDLDDVCVVLKTTVHNIDSAATADKVVCALREKNAAGVKRAVLTNYGYVANLSYDAASNDVSRTGALSVAVLVVSAAAALQ
jgi:hypothetical protein